MSDKITIVEVKDSGAWLNLKDKSGVEYGTKKEESPKIMAQIQDATAMNKSEFELECRITTTSSGKKFCWDVKEQKQGGGGGFRQPRNEKVIIAQSCIGYAVEYHNGHDPVEKEDVLKTAEYFFNWVCTKGGIQ